MDPQSHSLHDASIEEVSIGRGDVALRLALGSARFSAPELPEEALLRLSSIANFEVVRAFFETDFGPDPISRVDQVIFSAGDGDVRHSVLFELDPQGLIDVQCGDVSLAPTD